MMQASGWQPARKLMAPGSVLPRAVLWFLVVLLAVGCATPDAGLRPEYPPIPTNVPEPALIFVAIDSLQPTLRWESFPRDKDRKAGLVSRIRNVTYDLRICRADDLGPVVYARQGLLAPSHQIEEPLEPSTEYFWAVRARFELDGHARVTEWSGFGDIADRSPRRTGRSWGWVSWRAPTLPLPNYYRFKTPPK